MYTHPTCVHIQSLLLDEWSRQYQYFQLIGVLCGMVIYNAVIVNLPFPTALYKKLLKRFAAVNFVGLTVFYLCGVCESDFVCMRLFSIFEIMPCS